MRKRICAIRQARLTLGSGDAKPARMITGWGWRVALVVALGGLGGCVTVSAPDKPIVIELNINIRQEVVYRLDAGVQDLIDQNAEIF